MEVTMKWGKEDEGEGANRHAASFLFGRLLRPVLCGPTPAKQPRRQPTRERINQPTSPATKQQARHLPNHPTRQPARQPTRRPINEPTIFPTLQPARAGAGAGGEGRNPRDLYVAKKIVSLPMVQSTAEATYLHISEKGSLCFPKDALMSTAYMRMDPGTLSATGASMEETSALSNQPKRKRKNRTRERASQQGSNIRN